MGVHTNSNCGCGGTGSGGGTTPEQPGNEFLQNNIGRKLNAGIVTIAPVANNNLYDFAVAIKVAENLNKVVLTITEIQTPVIVDVIVFTQGSLGSKKHKLFFSKGKGKYGPGGTTLQPGDFELFYTQNLLIGDITDGNAYATFVDLGNLPDGDYLSAANSAERDFIDEGQTYFITYNKDGKAYLLKFNGEPGYYGGSYPDSFILENFLPASDSDVQPEITRTDQLQNTGANGVDKYATIPEVVLLDPPTGNSQVIKKGGLKVLLSGIEALWAKITGNVEVTGNVSSGLAPTEPEHLTRKDWVNGMNISVNQATAELFLKNADGTNLATINLAFLNNEGTTFYFNDDTRNLELKNDDGEVLSVVPASSFVTGLIRYAGFNGATPHNLEFKDPSNNVVATVPVGMVNVQGLIAALNTKANADGSNAVPFSNWPINAASSFSTETFGDAYGNFLNDGETITHAVGYDSAGNRVRRYTASNFKLWLAVAMTDVSGLVTALANMTTAISLKANDTDVVHRTGNLAESINGAKTFTNTITYSSANFDVTIDNITGVSIIDKIVAASGWSRMFRIADSAGATLGGVGIYGSGQNAIYGYLAMNANNHTGAILKFNATGIGIGLAGTTSPAFPLDVIGSSRISGNLGIGSDPVATWKLKLQGQFGISALNTTGESVWELYSNAKEIRHNYGFKLVGYSGLATGQTWYINGVDGSANFEGKITTIPATNANEVIVKSQLDSGLATTANNVAANYVPSSGASTVAGTKTFTEAPVVPAGTLAAHAVNKSQLDALSSRYLALNSNGGGLTQLGATADANTLNTMMGYGGSNVINFPTSGSILSMMFTDGMFGGQLHIAAASQAGNGGIRYRSRYSGVNSAWEQLAERSWVTAALATAANNVASNYVPLNGASTVNGTKTFTEAPVVPAGTLASHAVNKGQLERTSFISKAANYTIVEADFGVNSDLIVYVDTSGGAASIRLPSLTVMAGRRITVIKTDTSVNSLTVSPPVSSNINGYGNQVLYQKDNYITVVCNGSYINIVSRTMYTVEDRQTVLSQGALNTSYHSVPVGFEVICADILTGGLTYKKITENGSADRWVQISSTPVAQ